MNCCECNKETDKPLTHYGELYCRECFYETTGKCVCDNCNEVVPEWQAIVIPEEESCFCSEECAFRKDFVVCEDCGKWHHSFYSNYIVDYGYVCDTCYNDGDYFECEKCEQKFDADDYGGLVYCKRCMRKSRKSRKSLTA